MSSSTHHDDGFKSLNGNGSSDNLEEDILTYSNIALQTSQSTSAEQLSNTPQHDQFVEKIECHVTMKAKKSTDGLKSKNISCQKRGLRYKKKTKHSRLSAIQTSKRFQYAVNSESENGGSTYPKTPTTAKSSFVESNRVSCTIWENNQIKQANLSVLDICSTIIAKVEDIPGQLNFLYMGVVWSLIIAVMPSIGKLVNSLILDSLSILGMNMNDPLKYFYKQNLSAFYIILNDALEPFDWKQCIVITTLLKRFCLSQLFFFLLTVAEYIFKQKLFYVKYSLHLTSLRKARKSKLPHFNLNTKQNIKTWLSICSYLKNHGPQRSIDVIVSSLLFIIAPLFIVILNAELVEDTFSINPEYQLEFSIWCLVLGIFLWRFLVLGSNINKKYKHLSTLVTNQINLYMQIEKNLKKKKKDLMDTNRVLNLAADLLKELESPFKILGQSDHTYLIKLIKVVVMTAMYCVLSELIGFRSKMHKIKIIYRS